MGTPIRIQKALAQAGIASRREAERMIEEGRIKVNGKKVTQLGSKVDADRDKIMVDGKPLNLDTHKIYALFYKPPKCVTSKSDPEGRPTIYDYMKGLPPHIAYAGRLDWDAEGALILSNDGEFISALTHPRYKISKTYEVKVSKTLSNAALQKMRDGIKLDGKKTAPAEVEMFDVTDGGNCWLRIVLREGRKNQIKRMLSEVGHRCMRIVRVGVGSVTIDGMQPTEWRMLTEPELESLRKEIAEAAKRAEEEPVKPARAIKPKRVPYSSDARKSGRRGDEGRPPRKEAEKTLERKRSSDEDKPDGRKPGKGRETGKRPGGKSSDKRPLRHDGRNKSEERRPSRGRRDGGGEKRSRSGGRR